MAGLVGAILVALGVAGYAAGDFLDIDPVETASVKTSGAAAPEAAMKVLPVDLQAEPEPMKIKATAQPAEPPKAPAPPQADQTAAAPALSTDPQSDKVGRELRKKIARVAVASPVLVPPSSAAQVAELAPDVAVAESEAEVAKLEAALGMAEPAPETEVEIARLERAATPSEAAVSPEEADNTAMGGPYIPAAGLRSTRVTRYVNLREGPADEARVIAVIPTNATVQAETDCGWCVVTYNGKQGYVYKGFLDGRGGSGGKSRAAKRLTGKPGLY